MALCRWGPCAGFLHCAHIPACEHGCTTLWFVFLAPLPHNHGRGLNRDNYHCFQLRRCRRPSNTDRDVPSWLTEPSLKLDFSAGVRPSPCSCEGKKGKQNSRLDFSNVALSICELLIMCVQPFCSVFVFCISPFVFFRGFQSYYGMKSCGKVACSPFPRRCFSYPVIIMHLILDKLGILFRMYPGRVLFAAWHPRPPTPITLTAAISD